MEPIQAEVQHFVTGVVAIQLAPHQACEGSGGIELVAERVAGSEDLIIGTEVVPAFQLRLLDLGVGAITEAGRFADHKGLFQWCALARSHSP